MKLKDFKPIPDKFFNECRFDYDRPMTYYRVTHMPTGATSEIKYDQSFSELAARREVLQLCYNLYCEFYGPMANT
jgi:hypothetical protein